MSFKFNLNFLKGQKLGKKLIISFLILAGIAAAIGIVGISGILNTNDAWQNAKDQGLDIREIADHLEISLLNGRRAEKDFLLNYKAIGIEEAEKKYITGRFSKAMDNGNQSIESLNQAAVKNNNHKNIKQTEELADHLKNYNDGMLGVVEVIKSIGYKELYSYKHKIVFCLLVYPCHAPPVIKCSSELQSIEPFHFGLRLISFIFETVVALQSK